MKRYVCYAIAYAAMCLSSVAGADNYTQAPGTCFESGSFPVMAKGFVPPEPTGMVIYKWYTCERKVELFFPGFSGKSNSHYFYLDGLPEFLQPQTIKRQTRTVAGFDNSIEKYSVGLAVRAHDSVIVLGYEGQEDGWSAFGLKGFGEQVITIFLD